MNASVISLLEPELVRQFYIAVESHRAHVERDDEKLRSQIVPLFAIWTRRHELVNTPEGIARRTAESAIFDSLIVQCRGRTNSAVLHATDYVQFVVQEFFSGLDIPRLSSTAAQRKQLSDQFAAALSNRARDDGKSKGVREGALPRKFVEVVISRLNGDAGRELLKKSVPAFEADRDAIEAELASLRGSAKQPASGKRKPRRSKWYKLHEMIESPQNANLTDKELATKYNKDHSRLGKTDAETVKRERNRLKKRRSDRAKVSKTTGCTNLEGLI